jgi:hypothetical protein
MGKTSEPTALKKQDKARKYPKLDAPLTFEQKEEINELHGYKALLANVDYASHM